jgi:dipeptidase D
MIKMGKLDGLKPERVFYYFEELTKIPRCSNEEQRVSDYLKSVGENLGLEVIQDEALNIVIKKPGTKGYEDKPIVVLQGHMDMVCEKGDDVDHDFSIDPINITVEEDLVIAKDTTLGGDNGIAVAMGLALLESTDIPHPPLELLVTTNEETGLTGADKLDPKYIDGRILINIDSEEEGTILVSCAGGERNIVSIPYSLEEINDKTTFTLRISGLLGGHSGMEIDKGRGNSNRILGRVLNRLNEELDYALSYVDGGSKSNAIPRLSIAKILLNKEDIDKAKSVVEDMEKLIKFELSSSDNNLSITLEETDNTNKTFSKDVKNKIITALMLIPTGVQSMSQDIKGLVESSNNLGVLKTLDDMVTIECAIRSSVGSLKKNIAYQIRLVAEALDCNWESTSAYPAWEYDKDSYIREVFKKSYRELYNKELKVEAIHAGLECGLFKEKFGEIDMVSFGPNLYGVHAPGEKLSISSTERTYSLLLKVLENI